MYRISYTEKWSVATNNGHDCTYCVMVMMSVHWVMDMMCTYCVRVIMSAYNVMVLIDVSPLRNGHDVRLLCNGHDVWLLRYGHDMYLLRNGHDVYKFRYDHLRLPEILHDFIEENNTLKLQLSKLLWVKCGRCKHKSLKTES